MDQLFNFEMFKNTVYLIESIVERFPTPHDHAALLFAPCLSVAFWLSTEPITNVFLIKHFLHWITKLSFLHRLVNIINWTKVKQWNKQKKHENTNTNKKTWKSIINEPPDFSGPFHTATKGSWNWRPTGINMKSKLVIKLTLSLLQQKKVAN